MRTTFFRRNVIATVLLLGSLGLGGVTACSSGSAPDEVTTRDCEKLLDHVVNLRMQDVTADQEQHRAAIRGALDGFVPSCVESTSVERLRCSLKAKDAAALAACASS